MRFDRFAAGLVAAGLLVLAGHAAVAATSAAAEFEASIGTELRVFAQAPLQAGQRRVESALVLQPTWRLGFGPDGCCSASLSPYIRLDAADSQGRYLDLREARLERRSSSDRWRVGFDVVTWGAVESQRLVDVVNQIDPRADPDLEAKLGQPLLSYTRFLGQHGQLELVWMPWQRPRPVAGVRSRLAGPGSSADQANAYRFTRHDDVALRWSGPLLGGDVGIYHFRGLAREPDLTLQSGSAYRPIQQTGIDGQWPMASMLWKLEALQRRGHGLAFWAFTGGGEYTISQPRYELGLLLERSRDGRDASAPPTRFADAWFAGLRLGVAEAGSSTLLWGVLWDREHAAVAHKIEFSRRLDNHWRLALTGRKVIAGADSAYAGLAHESHLQVNLTYGF